MSLITSFDRYSTAQGRDRGLAPLRDLKRLLSSDSQAERDLALDKAVGEVLRITDNIIKEMPRDGGKFMDETINEIIDVVTEIRDYAPQGDVTWQKANSVVNSILRIQEFLPYTPKPDF